MSELFYPKYVLTVVRLFRNRNKNSDFEMDHKPELILLKGNNPLVNIQRRPKQIVEKQKKYCWKSVLHCLPLLEPANKMIFS